MDVQEYARMLAEENSRLKSAGSALAVAAIRVANEYDGAHRLMLAVSEWTKALADEHGRGDDPPPCPAPIASRQCIAHDFDKYSSRCNQCGMSEVEYDVLGNRRIKTY